jgi:hypothetical protein
MRALANDGATASRHESPCTTPEELVKAISEMPRIRPPEPAFTAPPEYQRTTYQQGTYGRQSPHPGVTQPVPTPPPPLQSRTGTALKWAVSALLIAALGLGSWQLADALMDRSKPDDTKKTQTTDGNEKSGDQTKPVKPIAIKAAQEYYPDGKAQHPSDVGLTYDGDSTTYWRTYSFNGGPKLAPFKQGVGIVYDLGSAQSLSVASIGLNYGGNYTAVSLYAADSMSSSAPISSMGKIADARTSGTQLKISADKAVKTRYVLVWITAAPYSGTDQYSGAGFKQAITDVKFTG